MLMALAGLEYIIVKVKWTETEEKTDASASLASSLVEVLNRHPPMHMQGWYLTTQAAHSERTSEASIADVSLDTGVFFIFHLSPLNTCLSVQVEYESGQEQATAVEECTCPLGYLGLSCQSCAPGYTRWSANNQTQPVTLVAELWDVKDTVLLAQGCWTTSFLYTKIWTRPTFGFMGTRAAWHFHVKYLTKSFWNLLN